MHITSENRAMMEAFHRPLVDRKKLQSGTGKLIAVAVAIVAFELLVGLIRIIA
ncbi:hypothetical protein RYZ27_14095 [Hyphomonas sp. FCG-A18]|jgi:hypothetical protein|uniref:hypothetical protein n=1 Tax=Hyphomonas sp. FCG-A18 TaxID=3080019 RepID=UPI002B2A58E4|nr:hypothetical protein RYZ27_14095 [Hyphomonas sp. FCG-A18]